MESILSSNDSRGFRSDLAALRPALMRVARLQLRDTAAAEDAVQETLIAAMAGESQYAGQAALRTWAMSILRNKIVDHIRRSHREPSIQHLLDDEDDGLDDEIDSYFKEDGHWAERPADWGDPQRALETRRFHDIFEACMELLPAQTARVFMMREFLELDTDEICKELTISVSNCWVVLYRARMRLRECLQLNWFGNEYSTETV